MENQNSDYHVLVRAVRSEKAAAKRQLQSSIKLIRQQLDSVEHSLNRDEDCPVLNTTGELQILSSKFESAVGALARLSEISRVIED